MEAAAAASQPSARKEWRAVTEASGRSSGNEGREPVDVDFSSIMIDGSLDNDILQQRLLNVVKQREELQQLETDLRAQLIARVEIIEMRNTYDVQIKEHANANIQLQEQLREKEQRMLELERMIDEKDRELHAIRLDTEAVWAKEDLLREQSKELQSYRRERDNADAERAQHIKQIHDLQEHYQEKEQQLLEMQEQHRIAQEGLIYKDEQLREAQSYITRGHEVDIARHAELRDRADQYGQLWNAYTRQCAETERLQYIAQQLSHELTEMKERNTGSDKSHVAQTAPNDVSEYGQGNGGQLEVSSNDGSIGLPNGNVDNASFVSGGNASIQADHAHGVPITPNNLLGMPTYLHGQVPAMHPFVMHQQGVPHSLPAHMGQFHSMPAISSLQQWPNQQALSDGQRMATHDHPPLQPESTMLRSETSYDYASSVNGQALHSNYVNSNQMEVHSAVSASNMERQQALESIEKSYVPEAHTQQSLQQISSQFQEALRLDSLEQNNDLQGQQGQNVSSLSNPPIEAEGLTTEKSGSMSHVSSPAEANNTAQFSESASDSASDVIVSESIISAGQKNTGLVGKSLEDNLLDERSLLACIVRTIPPGSGGKIRISSTLPNRLGKMIAPMHWHDYKKKYGKLDEFVSNHPELFVIDGDFIQLREGAQEIIAATAAVAKVAAAAAAGSSSYSAQLPSVAVTPMAQTRRLKMQNLLPNGASAVKNLSKPSDRLESSDGKPVQSTDLSFGNGAKSGKTSKGSTHLKPTVNVVVKQPSRGVDLAANTRR